VHSSRVHERWFPLSVDTKTRWGCWSLRAAVPGQTEITLTPELARQFTLASLVEKIVRDSLRTYRQHTRLLSSITQFFRFHPSAAFRREADQIETQTWSPLLPKSDDQMVEELTNMVSRYLRCERLVAVATPKLLPKTKSPEPSSGLEQRQTES